MTCEMAVAAAQAVVDQKEADVRRAEEEAALAKNALDAANANVADKLRIKNTRDEDKARSKAALTQKEQDKEDKERDLENAHCEVEAARRDATDADANRKLAQDALDSANADLQTANEEYDEAVANGTPLDVAIAEDNVALAIGTAKSAAEDLKSKLDILKPLLEDLKLKLEGAETAGEQDRLAGEEVDFATIDNNRYELSAKDAKDELKSAEQARDSAYDNWQAKKKAVEVAKDALEKAQEDASDPKARKERADFDCGQAQDQLSRCQQSATCDGGDRSPPEASDCDDLQQAAADAAQALSDAEAARTTARDAMRNAEDAYGVADKAEGDAEKKYSDAKKAYEDEVAAQRTRERELREAVTTYRQGVAGLALAVAGLALALGFFVAAMLATGLTFGAFVGGVILAAAGIAVAEGTIALAGSQLQSAESSYDQKRNAVTLGKVTVANLKTTRDAKEKLWHDAEAAVILARTARDAARAAFDAADQTRTEKADANREAKRNLKDCEARKAAMQ